MNARFRRASDDDGDSISHFIREMLREMEDKP